MRAPERLAFARPMASSVTVSSKRLQEFLEAELSFMSQSGYTTITVENVLEKRSPHSVAELILKELPARYATRILQIENTFDKWKEIPGMREVHEMLWKSFANLRLVNVTENNLQPFTDVITDLRQRHRGVVQLLAKAGHGLQERGVLDTDAVDHWVEKFMKSRIGTEMLTKHYMALLEGDSHSDTVGIADTRCNPGRVIAETIERVKSNYHAAADVEIVLNVVDPDIEFSFIGSYLIYIVEELLMNSICASLTRSRAENTKPHPISITVCADTHHVGIQVSDKGGGIPFELSQKIWSYMFSSTSEDLQSKYQTGFSGRGMGLPLCRLYTQYMGGTLNLMSMPGIGTDVYLFFERIEAGWEFRKSASSMNALNLSIGV